MRRGRHKGKHLVCDLRLAIVEEMRALEHSWTDIARQLGIDRATLLFLRKRWLPLASHAARSEAFDLLREQRDRLALAAADHGIKLADIARELGLRDRHAAKEVIRIAAARRDWAQRQEARA